jgi:phage terminase large subunit-like protein
VKRSHRKRGHAARQALEQCRVAQAPPCSRIVVDAPASAKKGADACGIVAAGRASDGLIYVLADESVVCLTPQARAMKTVALWRKFEADVLVVEVNQGGDMVRAVIGEADKNVPVREVRAIRGKWLRAEPVAQLYEQGRVRRAGIFPALEEEMALIRPLARPARRGGLGGDGTEFRREERAEGAGAVSLSAASCVWPFSTPPSSWPTSAPRA